MTDPQGRTLTVGPTLDSGKVVLTTPEGRKVQRTAGEMEARGWVRSGDRSSPQDSSFARPLVDEATVQSSASNPESPASVQQTREVSPQTTGESSPRIVQASTVDESSGQSIPSPNPTPESGRVTFKTARGSEYVSEGGRTTRNKAPGIQYDPGDSGAKPTSDRTVYVSKELSDSLGGWVYSNAKGKMRMEGGRLVVDANGKRVVQTSKFKDAPEVGLHPVEFWKDGTVHIGTPITEIQSGRVKEPDAVPRSLAEPASGIATRSTPDDAAPGSTEKKETSPSLEDRTSDNPIHERRRRQLEDARNVPISDPRPGVPIQGTKLKEVMVADLASQLPNKDAPVYHETSMKNVAGLVQTLESGFSRHDGLWVSDNPDLALGQGGRGITLEMDPKRLNGSKPSTLANATLAGTGQSAGEWRVGKSVSGAVVAIRVSDARRAAAEKNPTLAKVFDFDKAEKSGDGWRIPRRVTEQSGRVGPPPGDVAEPKKPTTASKPQVSRTTADKPQTFLARARAEAQARITERSKSIAEASKGKPGRTGTGRIFDPREIIDHSIVAAANLIEAGQRTYKAAKEQVRKLIGEDNPEIARRALRLVRDSERPDKTHDDARFEVAVSELQQRTARTAQPPKATIREKTGQTPNEPDTITQREALRGSLKAEVRGAKAASKVAAQSAEIQAGLARVELSKQARKARIEMADERRKARADRAAVQRDAAETLRATLAVGGDRRSQIAEAMMELPPEVRGRADMLALVRNAETPADARRAAVVIQKELHRQSVKDELRSIENLKKRSGKIPPDDKRSIERAIAQLKAKLGRLKTEWTVRAAIAGKKKGEPLAVRSKVPLADSAQTAADAAKVADDIRTAIHKVLYERKIYVGDQKKATDYVKQSVKGRVEQIGTRASTPLWSANKEPNAKVLTRWSMVGWTPETLAKTLDGTLGTARSDYAEQLLVRDPLKGEEGVYREIQTASDTLDKIAREEGFKTWADLEDQAQSTEIDAPWIGLDEKATVADALGVIGQDVQTRELTQRGAGLVLGSNPTTGTVFKVDGDRRAKIETMVPAAMVRAYRKAKKAIYEDQFRDRVGEVMVRVTGTRQDWIDEYQPRQTLEQHKRLVDPNNTDPLQLTDFLAEQKLEHASFTKERTAGSNSTFVVRDPFVVMRQHIERAAKVIHLTETARAARAVFDDKEVRAAIAKKIGRQGLAAIDRHVRQISLLETAGANRGMAGEVRALTRNVGRAMTQVNVPSWLRQYGSLSMAGYDYGYAAVAKALPEAVKTKNIEAMVNSNPMLRQRYESDTASAGIRASAGSADKTSARAALFDKEQARLGGRKFGRAVLRSRRQMPWNWDFRGMHDGNQTFWESVRVQNRPDSHVATTTWLIEKARIQKEHPDWSDERVATEAGSRTAAWVHRRMNTSSINSASTFAKMVREHPFMAPIALFSSDRTKMFNLVLEARAADGGGIGKNSVRAMGAWALNAVWAQAVGKLYRNVGLGTLAGMLWGASESEEERKRRLMQGAGLAVAKDMLGVVPGGAILGSSLEGIAKQGGFGGAAQQSIIDNPVSSTIDQTLQATTGILGELVRSIADGLQEDDAGEPSIKAFNDAEKAMAAFYRRLGIASDGAMTMLGVPTGSLRRDVVRATLPRGDEMARAVVAIGDGKDDDATAILAGKMARMLKAGIADYKIAASFARSLEARLNKGLDDKDPTVAIAKGTNKAKAVTLAWKALGEAKASAGDAKPQKPAGSR